jgi:hypothetical protein
MLAGPAAAIAAASNRLPNIARAVDVDDAARRRGGRIDRQPADHFRDLVGGRDAAERDVGDDLRPAAPGEIFVGHFRHREAGRNREGEDALRRIAAREGLGHADNRRL